MIKNFQQLKALIRATDFSDRLDLDERPRPYFNEAWRKINKNGAQVMIPHYFESPSCPSEIGFLRLLSLHFWVRHDFKD